MAKAAKITLKLQTLRWRKLKLDPLLERRMGRAMGALRSEIKRMVSRPYPPASRPGNYPKLRSGDYKRSIEKYVHMSVSGKSIVGRVGTDSPYARRLEYGFVGVDRLGRNYNQAPRPHFRPISKRMSPKMAKILVGKA